MFIKVLLHPLRGLAAGAVFSLSLATAGQAETLADTFTALPKSQRLAVQRELARADLFLAEVDGNWNLATDRALRRSVETLALKTGDRFHPHLSSAKEVQNYMSKLGDGTYSRLLYGGNLLQRIFYLDTEVLLEDLES